MCSPLKMYDKAQGLFDALGFCMLRTACIQSHLTDMIGTDSLKKMTLIY